MAGGLDFETYGDVNLKVHGLDRYVNHPSFRPLMASVATEGFAPRNYDFILGGREAENAFRREIESHVEWKLPIVAFNAGFERAVLDKMGVRHEAIDLVVDAAVTARAQGAGNHLEAAAPQLTNMEKLDAGHQLISVFSVPNEWNKGKAPTPGLIMGDADRASQWKTFIEYCNIDAAAGLRIQARYETHQSTRVEIAYEKLTAEMNQNGWFVDLPLVRLMKAQYLANTQDLVESFRQKFDVKDTFFNSTPQMKAWCAERGVRSPSFDEDHVSSMIEKITAKLSTMESDDPKFGQYSEVLFLLDVKQQLGGASLKKLDVILNTVGADGRLRNQYMHVGAGQTYRTSARGAQLQNLKRLSSDIVPFDELEDVEEHVMGMTNEEMAEQLRQVFVAEAPDGEEIVGDFSSVESRGLAWIAGEEYKIDAYRQGKDIYKVLAAKFQGIEYDEVTKEARAEGKYSELSCGYQAGGQAVKDFMHKLGFEVTLQGAQQRVQQWRDANPNIVTMWYAIDTGLHEAIASTSPSTTVPLAHGLSLVFHKTRTPESLATQHPGAQSLEMSLLHPDTGARALTRVFHGVYERGNQVVYFKPSNRKTGDLWKDRYFDPKTKRTVYYSIYGGKLAGILTQSLCRELFFYSLQKLSNILRPAENVKLIGQFHDEIVVEWQPQPFEDKLRFGVTYSKSRTMSHMESAMSSVPEWMEGFPLTAEIKSAHRYIK